jgi:hypothetical protein
MWRFAIGIAVVAAVMALRPPEVKLADAARAAISARR